MQCDPCQLGLRSLGLSGAGWWGWMGRCGEIPDAERAAAEHRPCGTAASVQGKQEDTYKMLFSCYNGKARRSSITTDPAEWW